MELSIASSAFQPQVDMGFCRYVQQMDLSYLAKHNLPRLHVLQCTPALCKKPHDFSTLQLFNHQRFANYWFETGTPTFLIKLIKTRQYAIEPFERLEVPELTFSTYEIESLDLIPLLFQTGYLTIKGFRRDQFGEIYTLSYPNYEVKHAFLSYLLSAYDEIEVALSESHLTLIGANFASTKRKITEWKADA